MGDGAVIRIAPGATIERPLHLVFVASGRPAASFTRSLVMVGERARAMLIESHEVRPAPATRSMPHWNWRSATTPMSTTSRSSAKAPRRCMSRRLRRRSAARRGSTRFSFVIGGAVVRNQIFLSFDGEETVAGIRGATLLKARQHADTTLVVRHIAARLPEPRGVQVGARRRGPRRVPGPHHRQTARAADRRQDDDAGAAPLRQRRSRYQAGTGNLRRRRAMRPRRHRRRARRRTEILPDGARHPRAPKPKPS